MEIGGNSLSDYKMGSGKVPLLHPMVSKRICPRTLRFTLRASRPHAQVQAATGVQALCCTLFLH